MNWTYLLDVALVFVAIERCTTWLIASFVLMVSLDTGDRFPVVLARATIVPFYGIAWTLARAFRYGWPRRVKYGPGHTDEPRNRDGVYR
jgi:hypothetical protein